MKQSSNKVPDVPKDLEQLIEATNKIETTNDAFKIIYDAIDSAISAIIITDNKGLIVYVNPSFLRMFEYGDKAEVIGKNAADLFATDEIRKFSDLKLIIDATKGKTEEFAALRKDGKTIIIEATASNVTNSCGNIVGRMASFIDITERKLVEKEREKLLQKFQAALDNIKTLRGLLPICAACKNIRDDKGYWHKVEEYICEHSDALFSHSICPDCARELYPEFLRAKD